MGGETSRSPRRGLWDTGVGMARKVARISLSGNWFFQLLHRGEAGRGGALCILARDSWGKLTLKPVTRTVISSSWDGSSWGFDPMISQWFEREGEVERRRRGGKLVLDRGEVVRLFLGSAAGAGLCSSPQWTHCREICRRLLRFSFPSTTESGRPRLDLSPLTFCYHMLNEVPLISWSEIHDWNGRVPTSMATSYCMNI